MRSFAVLAIALVIAGCSSRNKYVDQVEAPMQTPVCWAEKACKGSGVCLTPGSPPCSGPHGCADSVFPRSTCETAQCPEGEVCVYESVCLVSEGSCMDDEDCPSRNDACYVKPGGTGHCVTRKCSESTECDGYCVEGWCFEEPGFCDEAA